MTVKRDSLDPTARKEPKPQEVDPKLRVEQSRAPGGLGQSSSPPGASLATARNNGRSSQWNCVLLRAGWDRRGAHRTSRSSYARQGRALLSPAAAAAEKGEAPGVCACYQLAWGRV